MGTYSVGCQWFSVIFRGNCKLRKLQDNLRTFPPPKDKIWVAPKSSQKTRRNAALKTRSMRYTYTMGYHSAERKHKTGSL